MKWVTIIFLTGFILGNDRIIQAEVGISKNEMSPTSESNEEANGIKQLVDQLGSDYYHLRSSARKQLNSIGKPAIPFLIEGLQSENQRIRAYSAHIIGNIGNMEIIPDLEKIFNAEDEYVRKNAKEAIEKIKLRYAK